jgi:hypothetical protein
MNENEQLVARVERVQREGEEKYGSQWNRYIGAIRQANPKGISDEVWRHVLSQENAADLIAAGGRTAMIALADTDDTVSRAYSEMREAERKEYRLMKGRGPR